MYGCLSQLCYTTHPQIPGACNNDLSLLHVLLMATVSCTTAPVCSYLGPTLKEQLPTHGRGKEQDRFQKHAVTLKLLLSCGVCYVQSQATG